MIQRLLLRGRGRSVPPRPPSGETAELNSGRKQTTTTLAKAHSRSLSQPAIFRPYDNNGSVSSLQNNLPPSSSRMSRPLERGVRRAPSGSTTRKASKTESKGSKNRQSSANTDIQSKHHKTGQSTSRTPTHMAAKNDNTGASDQTIGQF